MEMRTLNKALTDNGMTHERSPIEGKRTILKDGEVVGYFDAMQGWALVNSLEREKLTRGAGCGE